MTLNNQLAFFKLIFITSVFSLVAGNADAQKTEIRIKDFSKKYYAKVISIPDSTSYSIQVYEKGTNKRLIKSTAEEISESLLENGQLIPNIKSLPYGDQSVLIYEDFNFDGVKDFALMNGFQSCYSGPSFNIYLWIKNAFQYSEPFSELSNSYCGMFQVDANKKRINTMTKSGCCWHQYSEFMVKNNIPVPVKIVEESAMLPRTPSFVEVTTKEWIGEQEIQNIELYMPYNEIDTVFSFKLKKNNKVVCLFSQDSVLYYSLIRQDGSIEFFYPQPYFDEKKDMMIIDSIHYTPQKTTLGFKNKDVYYEVYEELTESGKQMGVRVKMQDTLLNLEGDPKSIKGSLNTSFVRGSKNIN